MPIFDDREFGEYVRNLPAASEADMAAGNNMPLITTEVAKGLPTEIAWQYPMHENGGKIEYNATAGREVLAKFFVKISAGDELMLMVDGENGIISENKANVQIYKNGVMVKQYGTAIVQFGKWYTFTPDVDGDCIAVERGSAIGSGIIEVSVMPKRVLFNILDNKIDDVGNDLKLLTGKIPNDLLKKGISLENYNTGYFYAQSGTLVQNASSKYIDVTIDSSKAGNVLEIRVSPSTSVNDSRYYLLVDNAGNVVESVSNKEVLAKPNHSYTFESILKSGYALKASWTTGQPTSVAFVDFNKLINSASPRIIYVATNGSDSNNGEISSPLATIDAALNAGADTIILREGVYNYRLINLSLAKKQTITIMGARGEKVIFKRGGSTLVSSGNETKVTGYDNVYSIPLNDNPEYSGQSTQWLWYDDVADENTTISTSDAHPLQRGLFHRCETTKIEKTTAAELTLALSEIDESTTCKWFYDSTNKVFYFKRLASTATNSIRKSLGTFFTPKENLSVNLSNIEFRYGIVNIEKLNRVNVENCSSKYVNGAGAFVYSNSISVKFDHCEASSCFLNTNGDGFNAHADKNNDVTAKYCQATLLECWSHDNKDDGYSDHEFAETTIDGGLFEYNGKAGVTPSYGCQCVCNNVFSRNNQNGFYYTGSANDEGNAGQVILYNCVAKNNSTGGSSSAGFHVDGVDTKMTCVSCKSISNINGYSCGGSSVMELIDCGCIGQAGSVKVGTGSFVITNTNMVND